MAAAVALSRGGMEKQSIDTGKYVRYTAEQVEALERLYGECPKPSSMRRQQLIRECPILANIEPKQIKVWFQNRRCREKQRKESCCLQALNRKLSAMNKLLMEENERLQKQVNQLVHENAIMRQQLQNIQFDQSFLYKLAYSLKLTGEDRVSLANDTSCESVMTNPQNPLRDDNNPAGLLSIAEEALAEFLAKATGTAVDWVQMPGMKPGPDSVGIVAISHSSCGVAARACGLVNLEAGKIADIFKDKPSWFHDCHNHEVFTMFPTGNGGTIELVYMQMYAPTTLAPARDLWTLRYTTSLEDGSLVICEKSLSGGDPISTTSHQFVRAVMLPSGCLIRPCEGGGSIVHIVDHLDLEASSVPEVLRPLYESSNVVAQKMTVTALRHVKQIAQEVTGDVAYALGREPAILRSFSQRLHRGFNDAINGFNDNGWSLIETDGTDVVVATNTEKKIGNHAIPANAFVSTRGVLCAKASMLLQSVPPALLVRFLREHRSEWVDYNLDAYSAASLKTGVCSFPGWRPTKFSGSQTIMPLAHTIENEESLEVVRLEGEALTHGAILSTNIHLLQICYGIDDNSLGTCFELVFAPIDEHFPDDVPLLASGFRVMPLDTKTNCTPSTHTLDLASSLGASSGNQSAGDHKSTDYHNTRSILTIAFQFPYEAHLQDSIASTARQYVRSIVSSVQRVSMALTRVRPGHNIGNKQLPGSPDAMTLAQWICRSYNRHLGMNLLRNDGGNEESLLKTLWHHQDAILCCSFEIQPVFTFANQAGLDMLETSLVALQDITLDKIFDEDGQKHLHSGLVKLMEQGYIYLPAGVCRSGMGRHVSFEQAITWKVMREDNNAHCVALCFVNWSFL